MKTSTTWLAALMAVTTVACNDVEAEPTAADPAASHDHGDHAHGEPTTSSAANGSLKPIMVTLGQQMAGMQAGLWVEDFTAVAKAAEGIADHPHVGPDEVARIKGVLGPEMVDFVGADKVVHDAAVRLGEAAAAKDLDATLEELAATQSGCVSCHTQFRARLAQ